MTRKLEAALRKILTAVSFLLIACAAALAVSVLLTMRSPAKLDVPPISALSQKSEKPAALDPRIVKLSTAKMTKTMVAPQAAQKPPAPSLNSLIRIKGIMDYGDPKTSEAIIESIRSNKTKSYRAGETLDDVSAVIKKIDSAVSFEYDGKTVTLNVNSGETADSAPTAGNPGAPAVAVERLVPKN